MTEDFKRECNKVGLSINFSKTKILTNIIPFEKIKINNNLIEVVPEYKYLGQTMQN